MITLFGLSVLFTLYCLYRFSGKNIWILILLSTWCIVQLIIANSGFYLITNTLPPRFLLIVLPPVLIAIFLALNKKATSKLLTVPSWLIGIHIVRIPVEIVLHGLYVDGSTPKLMTYEGRNFDILSGISALVILLMIIKGVRINSRVFQVWNFVCLLLLLNIVINAILSVPTPFQLQAFDQPNTAVLTAPYVLLPGLIVPTVLLSHLVLFRYRPDQVS